MSTLVGQTIDRYKITEEIGQGGMAVVYKAYDMRLEREVALKIIRTDLFPPAGLERILERFDREAKSLARLSQPNIIPLIDYGHYQGSPFLVMSYQPGGTLKQLLGKPMPWQQAVKLLIPVARALSYAHELGILHRDIKPSNILITQSGEPMVADFGIAKLIDEGRAQTLSGSGTSVGTPEYMAPEQGLGKELDGRADIYSLGIVLYELISGQTPYTADTPLAVMLKAVSDPLPQLNRFVAGLPDAVDKVLQTALAKNPEDRYPTMAAFAAALDQLLMAPPSPYDAPTVRPPARQMEQATLQPQVNYAQPTLQPPPAYTRPNQDNAVGFDWTPVTRAPLRRRSGMPLWGWILSIGGLAIIGIVAFFVLKNLSDTNAALASPTVVTTTVTPQSNTPSLPTEITVASTPEPIVTETDTPVVNETTLPPAPSDTPIPTEEPTVLAIPPSCTQAGETWTSPADGMTMVCVPAGQFTMGSNTGKLHERPVHEVILDAYWIDQTEVTNAMFAEFVQQNNYVTGLEAIGKGLVYNQNGDAVYVEGANWQHPHGPESNINDLGQNPVVLVTWNDAIAYCQWAGRTLPTEAQWEKAARGDDLRVYAWGTGYLDGSYANYADKSTSYTWSSTKYNDGYQYTSPVGNYPNGISPYGAYDMTGNVWEWTADWYNKLYYQSSPAENPLGPASVDDPKNRVIRGGSWVNSPDWITVTYRNYQRPSNGSEDLGFRCAYTPISAP